MMIQAPKRKVSPNKARIYFFYTEWCGFSQKAMPEWEKIEKDISSKPMYGKTKVEAVRVNCEKDKTTCSLYGIDAYPTVVIENEDGIHEYKQRVSYSGMKTFLATTLGEEGDSL